MGATNRNNAVLGFVRSEPSLVQEGNCIAFIRNGEGSMGYAVYKAEDFIATSDITAGYAPFLNKYTGMFITTCADMVRGKYSFNYKRSDTRLKQEMIQLPVDDAGNPDWAFMGEYMREIERVLSARYRPDAEECDTVSLEGVKWGEFLLSDLFSFGRGKVIDGDKVDKVSGRTAYVTRTERNNGVDGFIDFDDASYLNAGYPVVTIGNETAAPFVHTYPFYTGTNINILSPRVETSRNALIFIAQCFRQQKPKYSYGYAASATRLKGQKIQLPIDETGHPDYDFMERFIRAHEQKLINEYVNHLTRKLLTPPPP